jgi:effector-binding domain-containing protein
MPEFEIQERSPKPALAVRLSTTVAGIPAALAEALMAWLAGQGRTAAGPMWEVYWTDPDSAPPEEWRTEVIVPLA